MCYVMSMTVIISCSNKNHVMGSNSAVGARLLRECVFYPDQAFRFDADHVEATGRGNAPEVMLGQAGQEILCRPDKACLLIAVYTGGGTAVRSEEHTSELQSLMGISYAVLCLKKKKTHSRQKDIKNT